jgi:DNA primase
LGGSSGGDWVQEVRAAADIGRLIGEYVPLKQSGRKLKGLCPFHNEKTPSFIVDPEKQLFFCFGCRTGGDLFKFYMLMERVEFPDALRQLSERFGVPIPRQSREERSENSRLLELHREAAGFFRRSLASPRGAAARAYLERRGLDAETVKKLAMGYAPDSWDALKTHLRKAGYREDEMIKSGLAVQRRGGSGSYDRFRDRLIFPIERVGGGVIGFGGRILGEGEPKYLNSPETILFSKGRHLYGLAWSREAIRSQEAAIIVEGYTDFAALWQAGIRNAVAVLGTGLTIEHGNLLARFARRVIVNFDPDRAGRQATDRALSVLLQQEFDVRVLELPENNDPDDFVRNQGATAYQEKAETAPSFVDYLVGRAAEENDLSQPSGKARAVGQVLPYLAGVSNRVLRAAALARLADRFDLPEEAVRAEFQRTFPAERAPSGPASRPRSRPASRETEAERRLLHLMLTDAEARRQCLAQATEEHFEGLATGKVFAALLGQHRAGHEISAGALDGVLANGEREQLMEVALAEFPDLTAADWEACWNALQKERLEKESRRLQRLLQEGMEEATDAALVDDLLRRKLELRRRIDALS